MSVTIHGFWSKYKFEETTVPRPVTMEKMVAELEREICLGLIRIKRMNYVQSASLSLPPPKMPFQKRIECSPVLASTCVNAETKSTQPYQLSYGCHQ